MAKSRCGAGTADSPGFQEGNTCAASTRRGKKEETAQDREIGKAGLASSLPRRITLRKPANPLYKAMKAAITRRLEATEAANRAIVNKPDTSESAHEETSRKIARAKAESEIADRAVKAILDQGRKSGIIKPQPREEEKPPSTTLVESDLPVSAPKPKSKDPNVNYVRAPAGGDISDVNGQFYKGGHWMPIHGLSAGREKPEKSAEPTNEGSGPAKPSEEAKPRELKPTRAPLTSKEIAEKDRLRSQWNEIKSGSLGKVLSLGESPHKIKYPIRPWEWSKWVEDTKGSTLKNVIKTAEDIYVNKLKKDPQASGMSDSEIREVAKQNIESQSDHPQNPLTKGHRKSYLESSLAHAAVATVLSEDLSPDDLVALNSAMAGQPAKPRPAIEDRPPMMEQRSRLIHKIKIAQSKAREDIAREQSDYNQAFTKARQYLKDSGAKLESEEEFNRLVKGFRRMLPDEVAATHARAKALNLRLERLTGGPRDLRTGGYYTGD